MKILDPDKFVEDERFSDENMIGYSTSECPINRNCFCVPAGPGDRVLMEVCPHFSQDGDNACCGYAAFTEGE